MNIDKLNKEANKVIEAIQSRRRNEVEYILGEILMSLDEFDDAIKYQQRALISIINNIYNSELNIKDKELTAEPYRLALEKLEQLKIDSRKASK